jgi:hypothetical protein
MHSLQQLASTVFRRRWYRTAIYILCWWSVILLAGTHKYAKSSLLAFTESTSNWRSPAPSSESCCLLCCKCKDCWTCVFKERINCERYVQAIFGQFFAQLTKGDRFYGRFQQDSATAHNAYVSMQAFSDVFGDRIINSVIWPERSPDLNPCHLFYGGCLKDKVYSSNPRTKGKYS